MPAPSRILSLAAVAALGSASVIQAPLAAPNSFQGIQDAFDDIGKTISDVGDKVMGEIEYMKKPVVSSQALQDAIDIKALETRAEKLYELAKLSEDDYGHPTRVIGSKGHDATRKYILKTLKGLGNYYKVSTQDFPVVLSQVFESRLVIGDKVAQTAHPMSRTPPTKHREPIFARIAVAKNQGCNAEDYDDDAKGSIVFIARGGCSFGSKSTAAGKAGAKTAIIYSDEEGTINGSLGEVSDDHVPTFGLGGVEAKQFLEAFKDAKEPLDGISYIDAEISTVKTTNIVAETKRGDQDNCVMLGGHSDSVGAGPGINDDGSGSLTTLEVAVQLSKFRVNNCVRLAWWSAEEEGLLGSIYYANSLSRKENGKIRLFMDYDMLASPNFAYQIYNSTNDANPAGSEELRDLYVQFYEQHGLNYTFIPFDGRSDYVGFLETGIPSGGIATGAEGIKTEDEARMFGGKAGDWYDPAYHQLEDDVGNLNLTAWEVNSKLVAHTVGTYAASFDGYPKRVQKGKGEGSVSVSSADAPEQRFLYRGGSLIM